MPPLMFVFIISSFLNQKRRKAFPIRLILMSFFIEIYMIFRLKFSRCIQTDSYLVCLAISLLLEGSLIGKNIGVDSL
jgi:hypothetical protein